MLNEKNKKKAYIYSALAGIILSFGIVIWNGSPFIIAIYMLMLVMLVIYGSRSETLRYLRKHSYFRWDCHVGFLLEHAYVLAGIANSGLVLEGLDFVGFFAAIVGSSLIGWYLIKNTMIGKNARARNILLLFLVIIAIVGFFIYVAFNNTRILGFFLE